MKALVGATVAALLLGLLALVPFAAVAVLVVWAWTTGLAPWYVCLSGGFVLAWIAGNSD